MKPSGRRRFRKMNARFRQRGSDVVRERARETSAGRARKLIFVEFWGRDPVVMPPRPFSPRSLVGATQGARKRAVLREMQREDHPLHNYRLDYWEARALYRLGERLRPCPGCPGCDKPRSAIRQLVGWVRLARLRLYQSKRIATEPCNGFTGRWMAMWTVHLPNGDRIGGAWRDDDLQTAREIGAQHCLNSMRKALGAAPRCDGSGALPAKRHRRCGWWLNTRTAKNATQRCGMPLTFGGWLDCQHCGGSGWLPAGRA